MMVSIQRDIDKFLGGGLLPRNITHLYGPPNSGKTNLALLATCQAVKSGKVIYIDPEGGFSIERLKQICSEEEFESIKKNLLLIEPTDYEEQKVAIRKLSELVPQTKAKLVIVDSISVLYRLQEEKDTRELGRQLAQLLRIARKYDIPVLITNQVYTDINTQKIVPVGGDILLYWSKIIVGLEQQGQKRVATLKKHKFLPVETKVEFTISSGGIDVLRNENHQASPS